MNWHKVILISIFGRENICFIVGVSFSGPFIRYPYSYHKFQYLSGSVLQHLDIGIYSMIAVWLSNEWTREAYTSYKISYPPGHLEP